MKSNQLYPLILSAYYLDFSFPGQLSLETRVFLSFPFPGQSMIKDHELDLFEIGFEMNSAFNKHNPQDEIDRGLKMFIDTKQISFPNKNIKEHLENEMAKVEPSSIKIYFFNSEEELYNNLKNNLHKFLLGSYGEQWINFITNSKDKFFKSNYAAYAPKQELDEKSYIQQEMIKIDKFSEQSQKCLNLLLNASKVDEDLLRQLNISLASNGTGIINQILGSMSIDERTEIIELNKIIKTFQYYTLNNVLSVQDNKKPKTKKI